MKSFISHSPPNFGHKLPVPSSEGPKHFRDEATSTPTIKRTASSRTMRSPDARSPAHPAHELQVPLDRADRQQRTVEDGARNPPQIRRVASMQDIRSVHARSPSPYAHELKIPWDTERTIRHASKGEAKAERKVKRTPSTRSMRHDRVRSPSVSEPRRQLSVECMDGATDDEESDGDDQMLNALQQQLDRQQQLLEDAIKFASEGRSRSRSRRGRGGKLTKGFMELFRRKK